jgi:hypothetical protein
MEHSVSSLLLILIQAYLIEWPKSCQSHGNQKDRQRGHEDLETPPGIPIQRGTSSPRRTAMRRLT